ncbi:hypothetical protein [Daejeonella sp.]|uniref:hypothetical protein n=1 Tax=Daejeonella sp. TaxID=2805397 RepID=UPI0025C3EE6C|nr:hypothetical protein [Daejeonella sp.]
MSGLITAASDSAAFRLARLFSEKVLFFGSIEEIPNFGDKKFIKIPSAKSPSFAHELLKICLDNEINEVYPLVLDEIIELSTSRILFEEFNIKIIIPSINFINLELLNHSKLLINLIVLINGVVVAGDCPPNNSLPFQEVNGVFKWEIIDDEVIFSLFTV